MPGSWPMMEKSYQYTQLYNINSLCRVLKLCCNNNYCFRVFLLLCTAENGSSRVSAGWAGSVLQATPGRARDVPPQGEDQPQTCEVGGPTR